MAIESWIKLLRLKFVATSYSAGIAECTCCHSHCSSRFTINLNLSRKYRIRLKNRDIVRWEPNHESSLMGFGRLLH
ncbi:hypothetical protein PanWU01x14_013750 [Parasponia andersonii]|uniref:Uncharacterized protein n=1 Tax=Parasponia andersonii TaxID=3476 RepID=A0A2P5E141_PARAD|nr:hypothetical protein PanWU01x14_013750 [Parasponia andersonii]